MGAAASQWPLYWSPVLLHLLLFLTPLPSRAATAFNSSRARPRAPFHSTFPASAPLASLWTTNGTARVTYADGSWLAPILVQGRSGPSFACGFFYCPGCDASLFAVLLVLTDAFSNIDSTSTPVVVWAANRNHPISRFAALNLTAGGDLQLLDRSGLAVWSTNTSGAGVVAMNLTKAGSLTLVDGRNRILWQSFDHPTDTALPGQYLGGKKLVANFSANSYSEGLFYLSVANESYSAFLSVNGTPQLYYYNPLLNDVKGILLPLRQSSADEHSPLSPKRFMRFEADGHLRSYLWQNDEFSWILDQKLSTFNIPWGECGYPMACNSFGICTEGDCSCPNETYFARVDTRRPKKGCRERTPWSCSAPEQRQRLIPHENIAYFGYAGVADIVHTDTDTCKEACRKNCSCRAAFLKYGTNASDMDCYLPSIVLSLILNIPESSKYNSTAFLKVMIAPEDERIPPVHRNRKLVAGAAVGSFCFLVLLGVCIGFVWNKMRINYEKQDEVEYEDHEMEFTHLPGMPARFSYEELRSATDNFSSKLGEGGFGAVFQGTLSNGTRVAVKILGYKGQGIKEFLAEVETIGSVHHVNLVRLVGYCAERLHRLLVYEFLSNGSLEKWIFADNKEQLQNPALDWETKHKIILHVARGLSYLHEDCRHRIIHLDIKPQNILLDENFNAKVSDFGLSKLVDKDQSQVVTTLRGTPGYLAPEWLHSVITEKVDVYSFGVVVLETVSGKRILDHTRSPGSIHLVSLLKKAAEEDKLADVIGMECSSEKAMRMLRIAMWCLQIDYLKRPSMSVVVKVLEGLVDVSLALDHNFWVPVKEIVGEEAHGSSSTPFLSSFPSGPR